MLAWRALVCTTAAPIIERDASGENVLVRSPHHAAREFSRACLAGALLFWRLALQSAFAVSGGSSLSHRVRSAPAVLPGALLTKTFSPFWGCAGLPAPVRDVR